VRAVAVVLFIGVVCLPALGRTQVVVGASEGISFDQENYNWSGDSDTDSQVGELSVNATTLIDDAGALDPGIVAGYLNVSTSGGWEVQNQPVIAGTTLNSYFGLTGADGTAQASLTANVSYSATPVTSFSATPNTNFAVGEDTFDGEGDDTTGSTNGDPDGGKVVASGGGSGLFSFSPGGATTINYQYGHPNVQTAMNQCAQSSAANNLQWLSNTYGIPLVQTGTDAPGLKGDNTLVGQLDTLMGRTVTSRTVGQPTPRINQVTGFLQYLSNANLKYVSVTNEGTAGGSYSAGGLTSNGQGATLTFPFLEDAIATGDGLQASINYANGGGHSIEITGAGTILGVDWITYESDHAQTDEDANDTKGTAQVDFSFVNNTTLAMLDGGAQSTLTFAYYESVPEPSTWAMMGFGLAALLVFRSRRSPA
jgi:hypothetical protein